LGIFCGGFGWDKDIFELYYANKNTFHHLLGYRGAEKGGWGRTALDDIPSLGSITRYLTFGR